MSTIFSSDQLKKELSELKKQKEAFSNSRVDKLKKFQKKSNPSEKNTAIDLHNIERKIEDLERKLGAML